MILLFSIIIGTFISYTFLLYRRIKAKEACTIFAISLLLSISPLPSLSEKELLKMALLFMVVLFYNIPSLEKRQLRDIPFLKPFIVSFVWSGVGTLFFKIPLMATIEAFFFILSLTLLFDYRDKDIDQKKRLITFATKMSEKKLKVLIAVFFCIHKGLELYLLKNTTFSLCTFILFFALLYFSKQSRGREFYTIGVDGLIFIRPILFILL